MSNNSVKLFRICTSGSDVFYRHFLSRALTPASNLGYLSPPPQDNFSWVPNFPLGPPGWETKVSSKKIGLGYVKLHGLYGNP